ncbi:hypothetical protein jhhlp_001353 [Lomentospora prolificans]|uniref:Protein kinase domain-containing protein n=1 Tax=Lomentospora prolificans TaxID=41688 RepID=A0A2N3NHZ7_9PEZI|nr:hypothetical protein jhhlp_001353 [Lomentospora prolificans]
MALSGSWVAQPELTPNSFLTPSDPEALRQAVRCEAETLSTSPRPYPTDLNCAILEETESESESPNEPVTPVSGRQSREFTAVRTQDNSDTEPTAGSSDLSASNSSVRVASKQPLVINTAVKSNSPPPTTGRISRKSSALKLSGSSEASPLPRRSTFSSTAGAVRRSFSFFRKTTGKESAQSTKTSDTSLSSQAQVDGKPSTAQKSPSAAQFNNPPSPDSPPLEMAFPVRSHAANGSAQNGVSATTDDLRKKNRASTGLGIRGRAVNFVSSNVPGRDKDKKRTKRRANSFDGRKDTQGLPPAAVDPDSPFVPAERLPWPYPPDQGTGAKARRMSLSLPDDFTVDVAELLNEYEYQHKFLGRHGKHLGKGATCKVTLMARKGSPGELYAVKEFRGKSGRESQEEYEKKIKSEYSIAKSLHHPNIVETVRLCTDHGRWNHVMEYCAEGDLFGLVEKGYLKQEARIVDRNCLFKQLVQGVNYLHSNGIAHRDIKLENLLITKDSKLKITDFGVSEVFSGIHPGLREAGGVCGKNMGELRLCAPGICGSEPYIAPEVLAKKSEYDPRALDVWSSAIIMINLIFGGNLWGKASPKDPNYLPLLKGWDDWDSKHPEVDALPSESDYPHVLAFDKFVKPPALRRLLLRMLNPDATKRISMADVVSNRWMRNVECCQLESYEDPAPIDASKKDAMKAGSRKIYCHNHLPPMPTSGAPSVGIMPGKPGY